MSGEYEWAMEWKEWTGRDWEEGLERRRGGEEERRRGGKREERRREERGERRRRRVMYHVLCMMQIQTQRMPCILRRGMYRQL